MVKLAEKRDELEKLIEMQKRKVPGAKPQAAAPAQQPASEFSGMQSSIMEGPPSEMPQEMQQEMPAQMPPTQTPMQPEPEEYPEEEPEMPAEPEEISTFEEAPSLPAAQLAYNRTNIEEIEALIESVVEEKWRQAMESFGDINMWKEKARTEITSIKQEILRLQNRFENLERALIGRVQEYDTHVLNIGAEIKALEKVLQKIMEPLAYNVKELERLTQKLKK